MTSYLVVRPAASRSGAAGRRCAACAPGLQRLPDSRPLVYVRRAPQGTLYLVFSAWMADQSVLLTGLVSLLLSLLTSGVLIWLTYRTSKRLVTPVSWLANQVAHWDPRDPDASAIAPRSLPADAGERGAQAVAGADRPGRARRATSSQRERNFTRDASHELRTPLTVIRVATDLMLADPRPARAQQRSLARVQRAGRDMEAVIDAFLILAREADVAPQSEEFDVRDIVAHEVERVRPLLAGRPVELTVHRRRRAATWSRRRTCCAVMVGNLLSNAVRFTDAGQHRSAPDAAIAIDDPRHRHRHVAGNPGQGLRSVLPRRPAASDGKGMGLSIVRRLGERFGWPVSLDSEPGQGTTAVIRFAAESATLTLARASTASEPWRDCRSSTRRCQPCTAACVRVGITFEASLMSAARTSPSPQSPASPRLLDPSRHRRRRRARRSRAVAYWSTASATPRPPPARIAPRRSSAATSASRSPPPARSARSPPSTSAARSPARSPTCWSTSTTRSKRGQVIARIDPKHLRGADRAGQRAGRQRARHADAGAGDAASTPKLDYTRKADLGARQLVARSDVDLARAALDQARAQVNAAQAQIRQQTRLDRRPRRLNLRPHRDPLAGRRRGADAHASSRARPSPRACRRRCCSQIAEDLAKMKIELAVDEADIGQVKAGQGVSLHRRCLPRSPVPRHGRAGAPVGDHHQQRHHLSGRGDRRQQRRHAAAGH